MVWIYLAESADSQEPWTVMLSPSPTVKSSPTPGVCCSLGCTQGTYLSHQYGMTYQLFVEPCSHKLTLSTAASLAKTSALLASERVWTESEAVYFSKLCAWSKKSSPRSYSLRTSQISETAALTPFLGKYPRVGMIVDTVFYPLEMWEPRTKEIGGLYWPTPTATDWKRSTVSDKYANRPIQNYSCVAAQRCKCGTQMHRPSPKHAEWLMGYPIGWTVCEPWAMPSSPRRREKRLKD